MWLGHSIPIRLRGSDERDGFLGTLNLDWMSMDRLVAQLGRGHRYLCALPSDVDHQPVFGLKHKYFRSVSIITNIIVSTIGGR